MNEIRAFVGHSFANDDAELVAKFLQHFERLKNILPYFSWDHAEAAKPKQLRDKVLELTTGKNVFIGICTKKERAIEARELSPATFRRGYLKAPESAFYWKTSDWIIQEIGLAAALNMNLILLLEDGLRRPGGLQGDVEYIPFDKNAPEKSFDKILEMITELAPKVAAKSASSLDTDKDAASGTQPPKQKEAASSTDALTPRPDWTRIDYDDAVFRFLLRDDEEGANRISAAYLATADADLDDNRDTWKAIFEHSRIAYGKSGDLQILRDLAKAHPNNTEIASYLAYALSIFGDHEQAAKTFEAAAATVVTSNVFEHARLMGLAASQYERAGKQEQADEIIKTLRVDVNNGAIDETVLLTVIRDVAGQRKDDDTLIAALERSVEVAPDNTDDRFTLAYQHSQAGNSDLALFHYVRIPYQRRSQMAWNNLGVAFDHFKMPGKSAWAYRKSEEMGETLAMANIGYKFISVGLLDEAREICDKALATKAYHGNVSHLLARLQDIPNEEAEKLSASIEKAKPKGEFYRSLGRAISSTEQSKSSDDQWQGPDCVLAATWGPTDTLILFGTYERNTLASLAFGVKETTKHRVEYSGTVRGRALVGTVKRTEIGGTPSMLASGDGSTKVLMVFSNSGAEANVLESPHSASPSYYTLRRVDKPAVTSVS